MNIEEFNKKDILRDFEYELNKLCQSCIGTATEIQIKQQPLINLFHQLVWFYEKEKEKNKKILSDNIESFQKYFLEEFDKRFISKNKILEILGIEETDSEKILSLLQTLVDENARLEDIEDKKVQIEYNNVFNKGVKSVEDKIKAKIKELEKGNKNTFIRGEKILVLQSLLKRSNNV